ncbi:DUF1643 domain-containing protein [Sphingomonas sp.]|uniref:DUF1643 domain-containing protein n=1 Tax=Sphingomonas sp. TaxID=28214 RepID=UPI0025F43BC3|nr:DUF1643 domain-containing protein [Sphingomonas sp.]
MKRHPLMRQPAVFSADRRYRYSLTREWDLRRGQLCWIMLNPSVAGSERDDPTIRRCIGFAQRWGFGGIVVVNLFGLVATYPHQLLMAKDPIGPRNDDAILEAISNRRVICAWGNVFHFAERKSDVLRILESTKTNPQCLGLTKFGHPSHPVRLSWKQKLRPFRPIMPGSRPPIDTGRLMP